MFTILIILTILAAVLLIGVVLIQKSKGGGLSSSFAGSNQIMGVRRTNNFIEKLTWTLFGAIAIFAVLSHYFMPSAIETQSRVTTNAQAQAPADFAGNSAPAQTPAPTK